MRKAQVLASALLLVLLLVACAPQAVPAPQTSAPAIAPKLAPAAVPVAAPAKPAWEREWEKTLAAARQEGRVIVHTTAGGDAPRAIMRIAKMQGIEAEVFTTRLAELLAKVFIERRAGLYLNDVWLSGVTRLVTIAKPAGILETVDSAFILPELTDPERIKKVWYQGTLPWVDREHTLFVIAMQPGTVITINTDLVKPEEVKSWRDVLDPKWRGKVAFNDPTVGGYGEMCFQAMVNIMGEDYARELAKTKPSILRDQRQLVEWLAHGKLAIALAAPVEILVEFLKAGAHIKPVIPQEGTYLGTGSAGVMVLLKNAPHPNASKVFINWLTSKEGQEIFAPAGGWHSTRVDVSTAHLLPGFARTELAKYWPAYTEENVLKYDLVNKLGKELFGPP